MNAPFRDLLASSEEDERMGIINPMFYLVKYLYQPLQKVRFDTVL